MLSAERDWRYIVYPSWAALPHTWEELPRILSRYTLQTPVVLESRDQGSIQVAPRIEYLQGAVGGGIVAIPMPLGEAWPGFLVLREGANPIDPCGPGVCTQPGFPAQVLYLEPMDCTVGMRLGSEKRPKIYTCGATPEHAETAGGEFYWLVSLRPGKQAPVLHEKLTVAACGFGLDIEELREIPAALREETIPWFGTAEFELRWFRGVGGEPLLGRQFAFLLYVALAARHSIGRLHAMHLVANIEGKPNFRKNWYRR